MRGMKSKAVDIAYSRKHDCNTAFGFLLILNMIRHMKPYSLLWLGIPCSSWIFLSRGSTRRHPLRVLGSTSEQIIEEGVLPVRGSFESRNCSMFDGCPPAKHGEIGLVCTDHQRIKYAASRRIYFIIENPPTSLLWKMPALKESRLNGTLNKLTSSNNCSPYRIWEKVSMRRFPVPSFPRPVLAVRSERHHLVAWRAGGHVREARDFVGKPTVAG